MTPHPTIRIGISGWRYAPWRGRFYPTGLPQRAELEYAAGCFSSIEINGSFYSLQSPRSWQAWYESTPEDFVFAVKGPRYITHMLRLKQVEKPRAHSLAISAELRFRCRPTGEFPRAITAHSQGSRGACTQARELHARPCCLG